MGALLYVILNFFINNVVICSNGDCPYGFTYIHGTKKCYIIAYSKLSWLNAGTNCKHYHPKSRLLVIKDRREQDAIVSYFLNPRIGNPPVNSPLFSYINFWKSGFQNFVYTL